MRSSRRVAGQHGGDDVGGAVERRRLELGDDGRQVDQGAQGGAFQDGAFCRMVKKPVPPHNKVLQEAPEEESQLLSTSILRGMPTRSDPLAPDHDGHDVIQLQG